MSGAAILGLIYTPVISGTYMQTFIWTILIAGGSALLYVSMLLIMRADIVMTVISRLRKRM
jgi:hypothetical protein